MKKLKAAPSILLLKQSTYKTPLRYFLAVVCGYCIDFAIYAAFVLFGVSVYGANTAGFCVGATVNVILIRQFVFPDSRFRLSTDLQLSFVSNGLMFGFGMGMLWVFVESVSIDPFRAKLLTNGTTFLVNYIIRHAFFRRK